MLRIRADQFVALERAVLEAVVERVAAELRLELRRALAGLPEDALRRASADAMEKAVRLGIRSDSGIRFLIATIVLVGPRFDEHPTIAAILGDDEHEPPEGRLGRVLRECGEDVWHEAARWGEPRGAVEER